MKKVIGIALLLLISAFHGCVERESFHANFSNPQNAFSSFYEKANLSINFSSSYELPISMDDIVNNEVVSILNLSSTQIEFLEKHGFVIIDYGKFDDFSEIYEEIWRKGIPIFITTDTFLHLYHMNFNEILKEMEENEFYDMMVELTQAMFEKSKENYASYEGILKEAARRNVAYFGVALSLLKNESVPEYVAEEVEKELENINKHAGFEESPIFNYREDYSQYLPRGHYTQSEKLRRYFKAMMWYGRIAFFLQRGKDTVNEENATISTIQATMISLDMAKNMSIWNLWNKIYSITSFFIGFADDLIPYDYIKAIDELFGDDFRIEMMEDSSILNRLREKLKEVGYPKIYGGSGILWIRPHTNWSEKINETIGMRFMGQRYVPDSYIFQQLVSPAVGMYVGNDEPFTMEYTFMGPARCFPRGLDVFAVLGSDEALSILENEGDTEYAGENKSYYQQMEKLREKFGNMSVEEWNRNLYYSWLYALSSLVQPYDYYPSFMRTEEWRYKELQTSLASWVELRHDTILYAKQSYTPRYSGISEGDGYVEPVPEFYLRLLSLINMTIEGLGSMNAINESQIERLSMLKNMVENVLKISIDEIEGKDIGKYSPFFGNFVQDIKEAIRAFNEEAGKTIMVADVHTDTNTMKCLEEATGHLDMAIVAYEKNGKIYLAAGPIMSYYEFKQPISERLDDDAWEKMVDHAEIAPWQEKIYPK